MTAPRDTSSAARSRHRMAGPPKTIYNMHPGSNNTSTETTPEPTTPETPERMAANPATNPASPKPTVRVIAKYLRRIKRRKIRPKMIEPPLEGRPRRINDERAQPKKYQQRLEPPKVAPHRRPESPRSNGGTRVCHAKHQQKSTARGRAIGRPLFYLMPAVNCCLGFAVADSYSMRYYFPHENHLEGPGDDSPSDSGSVWIDTRDRGRICAGRSTGCRPACGKDEEGGCRGRVAETCGGFGSGRGEHR